MGIADRYSSGQFNFFCDLCGRKAKSSTAMKTWDNHYVCRHHKEARNPQDFLKGIKDNQSLPWTRPETPDQFVKACTLTGIISGPGYSVPGCWIPGYISPVYPMTAPQAVSHISIPGYAIPGEAWPSSLS